MEITLKRAKAEEVSLLAQMNRELIEDEKHENPMTLSELSSRMREFLEGAYVAALILRGQEVIGYLLYRDQPRVFRPGARDLYLRQFFIKRELRGQGYGRKAFEIVRRDWFPPNSVISVEVLSKNPGALAFWRKLGFEDYCLSLRQIKSS